MLIKNGTVFTKDGVFAKRDIGIRQGRFCLQDAAPDGDVIDASGCMVIPGLFDIHTHGAMGYDFCDALPEGLAAMSDFYMRNGVTSFFATSMTLPEKDLAKAYGVLRDCRPSLAAFAAGINMEGPFFSKEKKGAQNPAYLMNPDYEMFMRLQDVSGGIIRMVCVAPELPGAAEFIKKAKDVCVVSVAHTTAGYDTIMAAFEAGASHVTHLFNGMNPFLHREPAVVGAAFDSGAYVELICDGYHVHPSVVRSIFKLFGADRICMISDSMCCAGVGDGTYDLGGLAVTVSGGKATLANGTIAGSSINLMTGLRRAVSFGIPLEDAVISCTRTPAASVGMDNVLGVINEGYIANCIVIDKDLEIQEVIAGGRRCQANG